MNMEQSVRKRSETVQDKMEEEQCERKMRRKTKISGNEHVSLGL